MNASDRHGRVSRVRLHDSRLDEVSRAGLTRPRHGSWNERLAPWRRACPDAGRTALGGQATEVRLHTRRVRLPARGRARMPAAPVRRSCGRRPWSRIRCVARRSGAASPGERARHRTPTSSDAAGLPAAAARARLSCPSGLRERDHSRSSGRTQVGARDRAVAVEAAVKPCGERSRSRRITVDDGQACRAQAQNRVDARRSGAPAPRSTTREISAPGNPRRKPQLQPGPSVLRPISRSPRRTMVFTAPMASASSDSSSSSGITACLHGWVMFNPSKRMIRKASMRAGKASTPCLEASRSIS
jgi:hypothetical protein